MKHCINSITFSRIIMSCILLAFKPFTISFYLIYLYCGLSDMIDGALARKTQTADKTGSLLDGGADIVFVGVCFVKILPVVELKTWMWVWICIVALLKILNLLSGWIYHKRIVFLHTLANKTAGLFLFMWIFTIQFIELEITVAIVCFAATFAAVQECFFIHTKKYKTND